MIKKIPFGKTGHLSSRIIFGAAAFMSMRQERADQYLEALLEFGVNHIDVAASYGDAELRIGNWMKEHRNKFFLASKTGERSEPKTRESIQRSLERLQTEQLDMIQLHNLTDEPGWETAMGSGGALEAAVRAKEEGLVRLIGVTGHGTQAPVMHLKSLEIFDFDAVLLPCNYPLMQNPDYAADYHRLIKLCEQRGVAVQTIKSIARRKWREDDTQKRFSWYEPIKEPEALRRAVHWLLSHPHIFLNTTSDVTLLQLILEAASDFDDSQTTAELDSLLQNDASQLEMEPIFIPGEADPF
ncbi:MAG: aldo/keto reductase [Deltaproteobacteria bacterium]|nr:aldo/keto reductase [Deltaproteobacteria bacterium]